MAVAAHTEGLRLIESRRSLRRLLALSAAGACFLTASPRARAAFDLSLISPQSAAMGGASLANTADSSALFLNPAASSRLTSAEGYFSYQQLFAGLGGVSAMGQGLLSAAVPTKLGTFGLGVGEFQASGLLQQRAVGLGYSTRLTDELDVGATGKFLRQDYLVGSDAAASDPVFQHGTSRGAFSLDLGLIATISDSWKAALAVRNINEPNLGLATVDRVPREVQLGLSYDVPGWGLRLTADDVYRDDPSGVFSDRNRPSVGLEKSLAENRVKFRLGATPDQFSGGVGVRFGSLDFDYAFLLNRSLIANNAGTHQVGIRYRFGGDSAAPRSH